MSAKEQFWRQHSASVISRLAAAGETKADLEHAAQLELEAMWQQVQLKPFDSSTTSTAPVAPTISAARCAAANCRKWPFSNSRHGLCREHEQARQRLATHAHLETLQAAQPMAWPVAWNNAEGAHAAAAINWLHRVKLVRRIRGGEHSTGIFLVLLAPAGGDDHGNSDTDIDTDTDNGSTKHAGTNNAGIDGHVSHNSNNNNQNNNNKRGGQESGHGDAADAGGLLVVKPGSAYTATEVFCALLYGMLGIHVPRQRVVRNGINVPSTASAMLGRYETEHDAPCAMVNNAGREYKGEYDALCTALLAADYADPEDRAAAYHLFRPSYGERAFCTVSQYVDGKPIGEIGLCPQSYPSLLLPQFLPTSRRSVAESTSASPRALLLHELGIMMAADVLVNNGDRFPAIHQDRRHRGNPGNILFIRQFTTRTVAAEAYADANASPLLDYSSHYTAVAIDNCTVGISDPSGAARYLACVEAFAREVFEADGSESQQGLASSSTSALRRAVEFLHAHGDSAATAVSLPDHDALSGTASEVDAAALASDMRHLSHGVAEGMRRIGALVEANELIFAELKRDVAAAFNLRMTIGTAGVHAANGDEGNGMGLAWRGFELIKPRSIRDIAKRMRAAAVARNK